MSDPVRYDYAVLDVIRAVDGDTVDMRLDLGFHLSAVLRFRLLNINTPERHMFFWAESTAFTRGWLASHKNLRANTWKADDFGRWLADVYDADTKENLSAAIMAYLKENGVEGTYVPK